ncbi:MAG: thiamine-phosphate kinase [Pseudomonadota bacterium]
MSILNKTGEFALIEKIKELFPKNYPDEVICGIGDDTAIIKKDDNHSILATVDMQVEGKHFDTKYASFYEIGQKALSVNISDIAAMGGKPSFAFISLGLPGNLETNTFDQIMHGIKKEATEYQISVLGGNIAKTNQIIIDIFLMGEINTKHILKRSGAKISDRIFVTGNLGSSALGLKMLQDFGKDYPREFENSVKAHLKPVPRIKAGQVIAKAGYATAMIDISDGLIQDLEHVCEASKVGAIIYKDKLPVAHDVQTPEYSIKDLALCGGEDYELLFTMKSDTSIGLIESLFKESGVKLTEIGKITDYEDKIKILDKDGGDVKLLSKGWDHYR